jgi:tubulin-folding cofactor B
MVQLLSHQSTQKIEQCHIQYTHCTMTTSSNDSTLPRPDIRNRDMLGLRNYITAKDDINPYTKEGKNLSKDTLLIDLTHSNLQQQHVEIRFHHHDTIGHVKTIIHQKTGTAPHFQRLQLKSAGQVLHELPSQTELENGGSTVATSRDHYKLGYFFAATAHPGGGSFYLPSLAVHCIDVNPLSESRGGGYEDVTLVEKFTLSDAEYRQRERTLYRWSQEQKARNPNFTLRQHAKDHADLVEARRAHRLHLPLPEGFVVDSAGNVVKDEPDVESGTNDGTAPAEETVYDEASVAHVHVGQRCQVEPGQRRGQVEYVGPVAELDANPRSMWVGVVFDEPVGKTDGAVATGTDGEKRRYFQAPGPNYGGFVRGKNVQVGDFPERDIMDELDSSDDEDDEL